MKNDLNYEFINKMDEILEYLQQMSSNTSPMPYTIWNLIISIFAATFGLISAYYGWRAYKYSKQISNNVARMSSDNQLFLITELSSVLYDSYIYFLTCQLRYLKDSTYMPSSSFMLRLRLPSHTDYFNLTDYNGNKTIYKQMVCLKQSMLAYNNLIDFVITSSDYTMEVRRKFLYLPLRIIKYDIEIGDEILNKMPYLVRRFTYNGMWKGSLNEPHYFCKYILFNLFIKHFGHAITNYHNTQWVAHLTIPKDWNKESCDYYKVIREIEKIIVPNMSIRELCFDTKFNRVYQTYTNDVISLWQNLENTTLNSFAQDMLNKETVINTGLVFTMMCIDAAIEYKNTY